MRKHIVLIALIGLIFIPLPGLQGQVKPGKAIKYTKLPPSSHALRVHFLDIGAGDAILIETPAPDEKHVFIDGGKLKEDEFPLPYLKRFVQNKRVDLAMVSHPDFDHVKGMVQVVKTFAVTQFWDTGYDNPKLSGTWRDLQETIGKDDKCRCFSPISGYYKSGDWYELGSGVRIQFVNVDGEPPFADPTSKRKFAESERRNNASLVIKLVYGKTSFLLTGDINGRRKESYGADTDAECDSVEKLLVDLNSAGPTQGFLQATVMKAPHHASNGASSLPFIKAVNPQWVVVSAGHEYNHPEPETLSRYSRAGIAADRILRTDQGDSTPELDSIKDKIGDDTFVFESDGEKITKIYRVNSSTK